MNKEIEMNVKELIAALSRLPENTIVLVDGYDIDPDIGLNGEGNVDLYSVQED